MSGSSIAYAPFPRPGDPFVDPSTGVLSRTGWYFLQTIYARIGGGSGGGPVDISNDPTFLAYLTIEDAPKEDADPLTSALIADDPITPADSVLPFLADDAQPDSVAADANVVAVLTDDYQPSNNDPAMLALMLGDVGNF